MDQKKAPETLVEWGMMTDEMSGMKTWDSLLMHSNADMRRSVAQDMHLISSSLVTIERRRILNALSAGIPHTLFDDFHTASGIDDRFVNVFSVSEWMDYCMSVATVEKKNQRQEQLMHRRGELLSDSLVLDPVDCLDEETSDIIAETHVLTREVLARASLPFLRELGLVAKHEYSPKQIFTASLSSISLLHPSSSSHIKVLEPV